MLARNPLVALLVVLTLSAATARVKGAIMYTSQTRYVEASHGSFLDPLRLAASDFSPFAATARLDTPSGSVNPGTVAEASMTSQLGSHAMSCSARCLSQWVDRRVPIGFALTFATFEVDFVLADDAPFRLYMTAQQLQSFEMSGAGLILFRDGQRLYQSMLDFQEELTGTLLAGSYQLRITASAMTSANGSRSGEVIIGGGLEIPSVPTGLGVAGAASFCAVRRERRGASS